jgi:hypothetical protein
MRAESEHRYQDALEWLHDAGAAFRSVRILEQHGATNRGRPDGAKQKVDPDQPAIAWAIDEAHRTGNRKPWSLAAAAVHALEYKIEGPELKAVRDRVATKIKAALV